MFEFTEQYEPLLKNVREIAEKVVKPRAREIEESDEFPIDMARRFFKKDISRFSSRTNWEEWEKILPPSA
jgi:hypothetical protein